MDGCCLACLLVSVSDVGPKGALIARDSRCGLEGPAVRGLFGTKLGAKVLSCELEIAAGDLESTGLNAKELRR